MVDKQSVDEQLKHLRFKTTGWGRTEVNELHNILLPGEEVHEVVNGFYEGGFALLLATDVRVLLIDKKPMNYLTVEDLRFDMINEMDYSHRLIGAYISIATGNKTLKFTSLNQPRLRKLIGHVQHSMAEYKKKALSHQADQKDHLQQMNQQLQAYLVAQHQHQLQLDQIQRAQQAGLPAPPPPEPVKPSPELSDYLFAQSLMAQHQAQTGNTYLPPQNNLVEEARAAIQPKTELPPTPQLNDLYSEGMQEIFGRYNQKQLDQGDSHSLPFPNPLPNISNPLEINALKIAYSKLPMALRNRKFGRPSFHAHSAVEEQTPALPVQAIEP